MSGQKITPIQCNICHWHGHGTCYQNDKEQQNQKKKPCQMCKLRGWVCSKLEMLGKNTNAIPNEDTKHQNNKNIISVHSQGATAVPALPAKNTNKPTATPYNKTPQLKEK